MKNLSKILASTLILLLTSCSEQAAPPAVVDSPAEAPPEATVPVDVVEPAMAAEDGQVAPLRDDLLDSNPAAPVMAVVENRDLRRARQYPMQPPTIPHKIDGYQVDINANRCMACHARSRIDESQAPMVSVTHFQDRDGNFLAEISPRRYFCNQCHVVQTDARPLVGNTFEDFYKQRAREAGESGS